MQPLRQLPHAADRNLELLPPPALRDARLERTRAHQVQRVEDLVGGLNGDALPADNRERRGWARAAPRRGRREPRAKKEKGASSHGVHPHADAAAGRRRLHAERGREAQRDIAERDDGHHGAARRGGRGTGRRQPEGRAPRRRQHGAAPFPLLCLSRSIPAQTDEYPSLVCGS